MNWPAYAEYKTTGMRWLSEVPAEWSVEKFRYCFRESNEKNGVAPVGEMLSVSGYRGVEVKQYDDDNRRRTAEELEDYRVVRVGQLAVNTMWLNYAGLGVSEFEGHISPAYRSYWIAPDFNRRYVHYLMRSAAYVDGYTALLTGVRPNSLQMSRDDLMGFPVLRPSAADQVGIANFLDRETAKIDALIAKQEQLIATLREERTAEISRNADMVGQRVSSLGLLLAGIKDGTHGTFARVDETAGLPLLGARNVMGGEVVLDGGESHIAPSDHDGIVANGFPRKNDVLLVIVGATIGKTAVYKAEHAQAFQRSVAFLRPDATLDSTFLWYQIQSSRFQDELRLRSKTSAQPGIYLGDVAAIPVYLPPLDEQRRIASFLAVRTAMIDELIEKSTAMIETLREYRSALITDAVTGKIDVRGVA
ncbi:restriction endonuclease subunit S [Rhodococcus hoagii]|nr:restriction endonuclease subunit S [Prescottella equi]NKS32974.1 restriction endonuclease subunit S [Prescottella equi]